MTQKKQNNFTVNQKIILTVSELMTQFYDQEDKERLNLSDINKNAISYAIDFCKEKKIDISDSMGELDLIKELKDKFQNGDFKE